jgi:hypothetical protein
LSSKGASLDFRSSIVAVESKRRMLSKFFISSSASSSSDDSFSYSVQSVASIADGSNTATSAAIGVSGRASSY